MEKNKYPVLWFHGMPMGPEVFQQNFLHDEFIRKKFFENICPNSWGIIKLEWDETNLSNCVLKIKELSCIMPDYTYISLNSEDNVFINLEEKKDELRNKEQFIAISVSSNRNLKQKNISNPRYEAFTKEVKDLNEDDSSFEISFIKPIINLSLTTEPYKNITCILGKISFNGVSFQILEESMPSLYINNYHKFIKEIEKFLEVSKNKLRYLNNKYEHNFQHTNLVYNLSCIINNIECAYKNNFHPFEFYKVLVNVLSNAFMLIGNKKIPSIPSYNHMNADESLFEILNFINDSLKKIEESYKQRIFINNDNIFAILPRSFENSFIIGIEKDPLMSEKDTYDWINNAIIGSQDKIELIQDERSKGAKRFFINSSAELNIEEIPGVILIEIANSQDYITSNEMLCIYGLEKDIKPRNIFIFEKS